MITKKEYKRADLAGGEHSHGFLHRDFPGETGYMMRASASLRQVWLTHADAFHLDIEKNVLPRLSVRKQVRARLRHVRDPGTTQSAVVPPSTMHPKSPNHAVLPKASCKTSNDCHTLMTTCSRPPKSPKTSTTATKRSSGNAYSHVCSDGSGGSRVFSC